MQFGSLSSINQDFQKRVNLHLSTASGCRKNWNTASISLDAHIAHSTLGLRFTFTITIFKNYLLPTSVIVEAVAALCLEPGGAVRAVPARLALAAPLAGEG